MPSNRSDSNDYDGLKSSTRGGERSKDYSGLRQSKKTHQSKGGLNPPPKKLVEDPAESVSAKETSLPDKHVLKEKPPEPKLSYSEQLRLDKVNKKKQKELKILSEDHWLRRNGHTLTYVGLFMFSILALFRPYEIFPSLSFLAATAFYFAAFTLAIYIPTQLLTEGNLTTFPIEVKAVLVMTLIALITVPIAKNPGVAWEEFNDIYIKAVLMFVVMINVLRTRRRLMGMMWLSLTVGVLLSYMALGMFWRGELNTEGYRVTPDIGGMFGNPNDLALHLVMMTPLAITLGFASRKWLAKICYFSMAALFIAANTVTYSRGGFLGLIAVSAVLVWKLGRRARAKVSIMAILSSLLFLLFAPGNYGLRMLSIFIPALDPVGSSDQRMDLLIRSIIVSLRNPWGIGIGNFPIVGYRNLGTHNSYTQVSSELGILGLLAYLTFILAPLRKLLAMERTLYAKNENNWFYYLSIGFQASIIGFMVSSFFGAVAYNWFIYYLIAYAVGFRRIFQLDRQDTEVQQTDRKDSNLKRGFALQSA